MMNFERWVESIVYALMVCPDVRVEEVADLIMARQRELEQEPDGDN